MVRAAPRELEAVGVADTPEVVLADAGHRKNDAIEALCGDGIPTLVAPTPTDTRNRGPGAVAASTTGLHPPRAGERVRQAASTGVGEAASNLVFDQVKSNRGANRFLRRGSSGVRSGWRRLTASHNLLELHRHQLATA